MSPDPAWASRDVSILIIDDDLHSQSALQQVLDSEGWRVSVVPLPGDALKELARRDWTLVIVNVALSGLDGPLYTTLKELALAPAAEAGHTRVRVLFLVPELAAATAQPALERQRLPYTHKPFHLHDFLEKVSDLLLDAQAISCPIRRMRGEFTARERRQKERRSAQDRRETEMFAAREDYALTEEEIAEYEKEEEEKRKKQKETEA